MSKNHGAVQRLRRVLGVNLLLLFVGTGITVIVGEVWLRRSFPFLTNRIPARFVPGVGVVLEPHEEVWYTDRHEYWTISRTNRLGFVDREPVTPERAASSCHIALVGDSFVAAWEVGVPDKVQVRLEALAARERPDLDITTSAFGVYGTSQVSQIPLYDTFVRPLRPKVVVLQAARNDYGGNSDVLLEAALGTPWVEAYARAERGARRIGLRLPGGVAGRLHGPNPSRRPPESADGVSPAIREQLYNYRRWMTGLRAASFLWVHLARNVGGGNLLEFRSRWRQRERWRRLSGETASLAGWRPPVTLRMGVNFVGVGLAEARRAGSEPVPAYAEALELTGFALDEFAARSARDGSHLVLLLHYGFGVARDPAMRVLAEERGIPVVDQYRYITGAAGGNPDDADFRRDMHWNPLGHRWAAEALWEYLGKRPSLCGPAEAGDSPQHRSPGSRAR